MNSALFFKNSKARRERVLHKMAAMRSAKARIRQERLEAGLLEPEPKLKRWFRFELGIRDKVTGDVAWRDLVSARMAHKATGLILKYCQ